MKWVKDDTDITDGIDSEIWRAIEKAIENNSIKSFQVLQRFTRQLLQKSIQYRSIKHFQEYIFFFPFFYTVSYEKQKRNSALRELHEMCAVDAPLHLKEIIWLDIGFYWKLASDLPSKKDINYFYYWTFTSFGRLLYYMLQNEDVVHLKNALNEFDQISDNGNGYYDLEHKKWQLEFDNEDGKNTNSIKLVEEQISVERKFSDYKRHAITGLKYWSVFLFDVGKISETSAIELLGLIKIPYSNAKELTNDIFFFRSNRAMQYMEWSSWDYIKRDTGKMYTPPNPYDWLTLGFLVDQIRENRLFISVDELSPEDIAQAGFLYTRLKELVDYFQKEFDLWKGILGVKDKEQLNGKCDPILKVFAEITRKGINDADIAIAQAPLSQDKIQAFKDATGKAWKAQARIHKLFKQNGNATLIIDDKIKLKIIGQRTFFDKAKMMFIDGPNYKLIYGTDQMGGHIGRWEDDEFFRTIVHKEANIISGINLVEVLNSSIKELKRKGIEPNLILLSPEFSYKDRIFLEDNKFVSKINEPQQENDLWLYYMGTFDSIPIYTSFSDVIKNKVIVSNFQKAFGMRWKTSPDWYEGVLTVEVRNVSDEEAQKRLKDNPAKWRNTDQNIPLTEDQALILIKTSVITDIWTKVDFQILDKEAYIVGYIKSEISE